MPEYKTPGVYIEEINHFPSSIVPVPTDIPVFIGYTEKAELDGKSLLRVPVSVSSILEYQSRFGGEFRPIFAVSNATSIDRLPNNELYCYDALLLFYVHGGGTCYILSVGTYETVAKEGILAKHFSGDANNADVFTILEKESEPSIVLIPDLPAISKSAAGDFYTLYQNMLAHCAKMQSRFAILDVPQSAGGNLVSDIANFRHSIGKYALSYGAAYYPWLNNLQYNTDVGINFTQFSGATKTSLAALLPEPIAILSDEKKTLPLPLLYSYQYDQLMAKEDSLEKENAKRYADIKYFHSVFMAASPTYKLIISKLTAQVNLLPPAGAIAGVFAAVDNQRGVWKAPSNVSLQVNSASIKINNYDRESMNIDATEGKSINAIREFAGKGVLVWGGRTLAGNDNEWRYVSVRRTMIMIETSVQLAMRSFIFEPNDANTRARVQAMIENFMNALWRQGALAGAKPEQAFSVQTGLNKTMTALDILEGRLIVEVLIAVVRPAEFIAVRLTQIQQQS